MDVLIHSRPEPLSNANLTRVNVQIPTWFQSTAARVSARNAQRSPTAADQSPVSIRRLPGDGPQPGA
jgi:hypothetical protein